MATVDVMPFLVSLLPFLNAGLVILIIDLILRLGGIEISKRDFNRNPFTSLFLGLGLILISNLVYLIVEGIFSQISPLVFSFFLLLIYTTIVVNMTPKTYRRHKRK